MTAETEVKKIEKNWEAIYEIEKAVQEKTGDPNAQFHADKFFLGKIGRSIMLPVLYRKKTKKGFTQKYYETIVVAKFCPFTGKPLYNQ